MCFKPSMKMPPPPPAAPSPAAVLEQDAPTKSKTAIEGLIKKKSGTKMYRSTVSAQLGGITKKKNRPINM